MKRSHASPRLSGSARAAGSRQVPRIKNDESPLAWLASRKDKDGQPLISQQQFEAGERLRRDFTFALLTPRVTANYSSLSSGRPSRRGPANLGSEMADSALAARERVNRALTAVGPDLSGILLDVCCYLKGLEVFEKAAGWPQRSAKIVLAIALQKLARHYGLLRETPNSTDRRSTIQHWGTPDYRPALDGRPEDTGA